MASSPRPAFILHNNHPDYSSIEQLFISSGSFMQERMGLSCVKGRIEAFRTVPSTVPSVPSSVPSAVPSVPSVIPSAVSSDVPSVVPSVPSGVPSAVSTFQ